MIDLGLPSGTKWACCNVGATVPDDFGNYYAWGETSEKTIYNSDTYQYNNVDLDINIAGSNYDVARAQWGSSWQMPSQSQMEELLDYCSSKRTTLNGVNGFEFVGTNGGRIFLPSAGFRVNNELSLTDSEGHYWSSTRFVLSPEDAFYLNFNSYEKEMKGCPHTFGLSVRPVSNKQ